jgi:hypothetical protein
MLQDYVFGWKGDALQRAMDDNGCFSATCGKQNPQDISVANKCTIKKTVNEDVDGCKLITAYLDTRSKMLTMRRADEVAGDHDESVRLYKWLM